MKARSGGGERGREERTDRCQGEKTLAGRESYLRQEDINEIKEM